MRTMLIGSMCVATLAVSMGLMQAQRGEPRGEERPQRPAAAQPGRTAQDAPSIRPGPNDIHIILRPLPDGGFAVIVDGQPLGPGGEALVEALRARTERAAAREAQRPAARDATRPRGPEARRDLDDPLPPWAMPGRPGAVWHGDITPELTEDILAVLEAFDPRMHARLLHARRENPEHFERWLESDGRRWAAAANRRRADPESFELHLRDHRLTQQTAELTAQLRRHRADGRADEVRRLRQQLSELLNEHFEVRQQLRERDLAQLESRLAHLRTQLRERRDRRREIIRDHLDRLIEDRPGDF